MIRRVLAAAVLARCAARSIPRNDTTRLTVFHVNERAAGPIPRDMNTADLRGDLYFEMHSLVLPLECAFYPVGHRPFECENEEVVGENLVISKLEVEVKQYLSYVK